MTLRKACRNCTASKRKCIVQTPQCARCAQKGLQCVYDLEPLSALAGLHEKVPNLSFNSTHDIDSGYCVMNTFKSPASIPGVCKTEEANMLDLIRLGIHSVPALIEEGEPAIFIHPKLDVQGNHNYCATLSGIRGCGVNHPSFTHLIQIDLEVVPVQEALTALQALIVHLAMSILSSDPAERENAETHLSVLAEWTRILFTSARPRMPLTLSPWQTWLFGESVRRTIIMSQALRIAHFSLKHQYCSDCLFLESLPFDRRLGLWMAKSPQAWIAAAQVRVGGDVGEQLSSFHEFAQNLDGTIPNLCGDTFLALLASGHNGRETIRTRGN